MSRPHLRAHRYPGITLLLVLSFLTALFAAGVPGLVERALTSSLQQSLDGTGPVDDSVTALAQPSPRTDSTSISSALHTFAAGVPGDARPQTSRAWDGAYLGTQVPVHGAAFPATFNLEYRSTLDAHLRLLTGSLPVTASSGNGNEVFQVALTAADAKLFDAHIGSVIVGGKFGNYELQVTGIVQPTDPSSAFWNYDPALAAPVPQKNRDGSTTWLTAALIGPDELSALTSVQYPAGKPDPFTAIYCVPLATGGYAASDVGTLLNELNAFESGTVSTALHVQITAGPVTTLSAFESQRTAVDSVLSLIMIGVATVGAATVLLCARLVISRRRTHFALLRARGQSLPQLARQVLGDLGSPIALALVVAGGLATTVVRGLGTQSEFLFGAVALVVLGGPPLLAVLDHRGTARLRTDRGDLVRRRPKARRRVFELVLVLLAVAAVAGLRQRGLGGSGQGSNTLGALAPILVAAVATAVAVRCYPLLLAPAARAARRSNGATAFLGLAGAARSSLGLALPTFGIVLTLTLAALGGLAYHNVESGRVAESWLQTGTDASITLSTGTDPTQAAAAVTALQKVPGVTHATAIATQPLDSTTGDAAAVYAVDPSSYPAVAADSPWPMNASLPTHSGTGPVPVVVSADSGYAVGTEFDLEPGSAPPFDARVVGTQAQSPVRLAAAPGEPFVLVPSWAVEANPQFWPVSEILLSGNGIDEAKVAAALARTVPGDNRVTYRTDALDRLSHLPLSGLAAFGYVLGLVAAGCFGICGILIALALTAAPRARRLTLLGTLGLSPRQARGIALAETAPLAASTALGGLLAALALPVVFGSALNLTVFTGLATETGLRLDAATPLLTVAAALALTGCGVLAQAAINARRNVPAQLRMGEDA
ncbi:hypothetical protein [Actinospica sp.]|uniref:hypothetical protein n=1 Tax=Actinospica sp. TaxID=1872142 RepID=UPI002BD5C8CA|nr:hypothetical protein [Actinospica sp.]HWG26983.1 hypothetical protein [Actinospica sp.]